MESDPINFLTSLFFLADPEPVIPPHRVLRVVGHALGVLVRILRVLRGLAAVDVALLHCGRIAGEVVGGAGGLDALLVRLLRRLWRDGGTAGGKQHGTQQDRSSNRDAHALTSSAMETNRLDPKPAARFLAAAAIAFAPFAAHADVAFKTSRIKVGGHELKVEVAQSEEQRMQGLMFRKQMGK